MNERKLGNREQLVFSKDVVYDGKNCIFVINGELEVLFNKDNALDIVWVRYKGVNLSFLSKNGLNDGQRDFTGNFEGGFLYTCGMDNISSCVEGKPIHGSLHYKKVDNAYSYEKDGVVYVLGTVKESALFGKNLVLTRKFEVSENSLTVSDTIENNGFKDEKYVLLYHVNYGYPFLDENLQLDIPAIKSDPLTEIAKKRADQKFVITAPLDQNDEDVYYHTLSVGKVSLFNPNKNVKIEMNYDVVDFPVTLEWKSMTSGDYALGIEPSLSRFDDFKMRVLKPSESKNYLITFNFN
ncbi:MAG: DUF4432 family protein [Clostridia bacterium]|nr:DUF4432 family protein [Clostridia bacterium]